MANLLPPSKPQPVPKTAKRTIIINGESLQVTHEEQLRWQLAAGALKGGYREMGAYFKMRDADQTRSRTVDKQPLDIRVISRRPASETVGDALVTLKAGAWLQRCDGSFYIALTPGGLDMSLAASKLAAEVDEESIRGSLAEPDAIDEYLKRRGAEIRTRAAAKRMAREAAGETIGYGSPPRASRYQPGQSGFPSGRPRKKVKGLVFGDQKMPGQIGRRNQKTVNEHVFQLLEEQAFRDPRFLRLWMAVKEREKVWSDEQTKNWSGRCIVYAVYDDISDALEALNVGSYVFSDRESQSIRLQSWFIEEALKRSPELVIGRTEVELLSSSMVQPHDLERYLAASGRKMPRT